MAATADLQAIRALSQYRPFEGGGESVKEAHQDLVLAAIAEADGRCSSVANVRETITTLFGIDLSELSLAGALAALIKEERLEQEGSSFLLTQSERRRLDAIAEESQAVADAALAEWRSLLVGRWPLSEHQLDQLERDLAFFIRTVLRRHGAEASMLLYSENERAQELYEEIEEQGLEFLEPTDIPDIRAYALSEFIRHPTDMQKAYLAQNLNTTYFLTILTIDPDGARLVSEVAAGQRVYLDTNFVYRLLGVQGPRFVKPAEAILRSTREAGYTCAVTPWTLAEFNFSLKRSRSFLEKYPIPPSDYAALAADASSDENFVTAYWRAVRSGVKIPDFFAYFTEVETLLKDRGIEVTNDGCVAVDQQEDEITDQISVLAKVSQRFRHPEVLEHDVKHRMLVERLRGEGNRNFSNAGFWFLTHDSVLPRYDYMAAKGRGRLPFCVTAGAWFQIVEAFRPKTEDLEQSLADMLASPYVRYRRTLSERGAAEIVARVDQFKGGSPELATRVFMNSAAIDDIESAGTDEERQGKIDSAIVAAAQQAEEDARKARELAEHERRRADAARKEVAEAERRARDAIAAAKIAQQDEIERVRARSDEALRSGADRAERLLDEARARHEIELETQRKKALTARRRLFFFVALVVGVCSFLLLDLAIGLRSAWSILIASAVLFGLFLGISQLSRWHSDD